MSKVIDEIRREVFGGGSTGITPTGTKQITENGSHDVAQYATAEVAVPNPSTGTKQITENGSHDVTDYATAAVNVPIPTNDFLPDEAEGYTVYNVGFNTYSTVQNFGNIGSKVSVYTKNAPAFSVGDKVCITGACREKPAENYAVWGTITATISGGVKLRIAGVSVRNTETSNKNIINNGTHYSAGSTQVTVTVPPYGEGSVNITTNGEHDVSKKATAVVAVPPYGEGSVTINANGEHDVSGKATAVVNVPNPSTGTKQITTNGTHDVTDYAAAEVNVPNPSTGTLYAENNNVYDVRSYAYVDVDVPPYGQGSVTINANGSHDVSGKATAVVAVPQGITPSGSLEISANGTYDVTDKASAVVAVPQGITPSGSLAISANGTYDVTDKASAVVAVPNDFLPAAADGYTVYNIGRVGQGSVRSFGNFGNLQGVRVSDTTGISVGDKVCITGTCTDVQTEHYAIWGTVTQVTSTGNKSVRLQIAGCSVKNGEANVLTAIDNGDYFCYGCTKVAVAVEKLQATSLYADGNGVYNAPSGYAYTSVEVDVSGGGGGGASGDLVVNSEGDWLFDILAFTSTNPSATAIRVVIGDNWDQFVTRDYSKFMDPYASASVDVQDLKSIGYVDIQLSDLTGYNYAMINVYDSLSA